MKRTDTRPDTWMPLYIGDYLRDTGHLTTEEHGAYMLLIMQAWTREGVLPCDVERLRMLARLDIKAWKRSKDTLLAFFTLTDEGYRHKRLDRELANSQAMVEQRRVAGKASAEARARVRGSVKPTDDGSTGGNDEGNGGSNDNANENPTTVATGMAANGLRNGRPSPSPSQKQASSGREPDMPRRGDPPEHWLHLTPKREVDATMVTRAVVGSSYLDDAANYVCTEARIKDANWRGDWRPLIAWLNDGFLLVDILATIRRIAERPGYQPPNSIAYFDKPIREAGMTK